MILGFLWKVSVTLGNSYTSDGRLQSSEIFDIYVHYYFILFPFYCTTFLKNSISLSESKLSHFFLPFITTF